MSGGGGSGGGVRESRQKSKAAQYDQPQPLLVGWGRICRHHFPRKGHRPQRNTGQNGSCSQDEQLQTTIALKCFVCLRGYNSLPPSVPSLLVLSKGSFVDQYAFCFILKQSYTWWRILNVCEWDLGVFKNILYYTVFQAYRKVWGSWSREPVQIPPPALINQHPGMCSNTVLCLFKL